MGPEPQCTRRLTGEFNNDNMLERVITWSPDPVLGDKMVEYRWTDYRDVGNGVKLPFHGPARADPWQSGRKRRLRADRRTGGGEGAAAGWRGLTSSSKRPGEVLSALRPGLFENSRRFSFAQGLSPIVERTAPKPRRNRHVCVGYIQTAAHRWSRASILIGGATDISDDNCSMDCANSPLGYANPDAVSATSTSPRTTSTTTMP